MATNCGTVTVTLATSAAPRAVSAFVDRVQKGFYDHLTIHRVADGFVIQGGDPLGTGIGGPGYTTVDTPSEDTTYTRGVVAMAKSPDQAAGSAGSQFFIVTAEDAELPPDYAVIGTVTGGMPVVDRISAVEIDPKSVVPGRKPDGPPVQPIVISRMTVNELD